MRERPFVIVAAAFALVFVAGLAAYAALSAGLPSAAELAQDTLPLPTKIYARDGQTLLYQFGEQNREPVTFEELPKTLINATVSAEDKTFWTNPGVDLGGIVRAAAYDLLHQGDRPQGASTITQQLVKQRLGADDLSVSRKLKEAILAIRLTRAYSKPQILTLYMNQIYYGAQAYGVKAAALTYFGTDDLSKLTLAQDALLAGLPQAPSSLDPSKPQNIDRARARRSYVLEQMVEDGYIDDAAKAKADAEAINVKPAVAGVDIKAPHFDFRVQEQLARIIGNEADVARGGYTVITTLDWAKQQEAEKQVKAWVDQLHAKNVYNAALVAIDPQTGEVLAYVGSVDYNDSDPKVQGQYDAAGIAYRQPGSSFKVFNYTTALEKGATPATVVVDARTDFGGGYRPENADLQYHGPITMRQAIRESRNIPAIKFLQGYSGIADTIKTAQAMGIQADFEHSNAGLSLTLGAVPVRLIDMTDAYAVLADMGVRNPASMILSVKDRTGREVYKEQLQSQRVVSPEISWLMNNMLEDTTAVSPVFSSWTNIGRPAALKTGTTDNLKDVYSVGYTPQLVTGVWMGNSDGEPMSSRDFFSAMGPGQLWRDYMKAVLKDVPAADWQRPANVVQARVAVAAGAFGGYGSGLLPSSLTPFSESEWFVKGTEPKQADNWFQQGCAALPSAAPGASASPSAPPPASASPAANAGHAVMVVRESGPETWKPYTDQWVKEAIAGQHGYGRFPWSSLLSTGGPCPTPAPTPSPSPSRSPLPSGVPTPTIPPIFTPTPTPKR